MGFVKVVKNNAYYKRFQVKYRRRREGKTDYQARKRLIIQDKDKYNAPKYRLVARVTNSNVIAQIVFQELKGDRVKCRADSKELIRFGLTAGRTNYSAGYATGLLLARRLLTELKLNQLYAGVTKVDGLVYNVNEHANDEKRPFKAILDLGLCATTTGNKVFSVLKGAADGGIFVPHSENRFPGFKKDAEGNDVYDAKAHRERIFGAHVDKYYASLKKSDPAAFKRQFSQWEQCLATNKVDTIEKLMTKVFDEIRKAPLRTKRPEKKDFKRTHNKNYKVRLTGKQRRENREKKFQACRDLIEKKKKSEQKKEAKKK